MKERPIIFNADMVRAILDGRKTQTRRPIKDQAWADKHHFQPAFPAIGCPYGQPGDRLWVRETWRYTEDHEGFDRGIVLYAASENDGAAKWKPSIHMPRWASRITLEITGVRVERVRDIGEEDAQAEGAEPCIACRCDHCSQGEYLTCLTGDNNDGTKYRDGFKNLWQSIYNKTEYAWEKNPWVWVIEFERASEGGADD